MSNVTARIATGAIEAFVRIVRNATKIHPVWMLVYLGGWALLLVPGWEWVGVAWAVSAAVAIVGRLA